VNSALYYSITTVIQSLASCLCGAPLLSYRGLCFGLFDPSWWSFGFIFSGPWTMFLIGSYNVLDPPRMCLFMWVSQWCFRGSGFFELPSSDMGGWVCLLLYFLWDCSLALCVGPIFWVVSWCFEKIFSLLSPWWVCFSLGLDGGFGVQTHGVKPGCSKSSGEFLLGSGWDHLVE